MQKPVKTHCLFCSHNINKIDYKDVETLSPFISAAAKIIPRKRSGTCLWHQRKLAKSIKRARIAALLPFVNK